MQTLQVNLPLTRRSRINIQIIMMADMETYCKIDKETQDKLERIAKALEKIADKMEYV